MMSINIYREYMFDRPYYGTLEDQYNQYLIKHHAKQNKGVRGQDSERLKTYKAEWRFQRKSGSGIEFKSIEEAQKYVNKVTKSKTYLALFVDAHEARKDMSSDMVTMGSKVSVSAKKRSTGRGTAGWARRGSITLDIHVGMNEYTVLHELAHCLGHWHHGRSFRQALVKLVSRFMGTAMAASLKEEMKAGKLSYGDARKPLPFDKWVASTVRMSKARRGTI